MSPAPGARARPGGARPAVPVVGDEPVPDVPEVAVRAEPIAKDAGQPTRPRRGQRNASSAVAADLVPLLLAGFERAAGLGLGGPFRGGLGGFAGSSADELAEAFAALGVQVEPVGRLGEAQIGVDA